MENQNDFNFDLFEQEKHAETERPTAGQKDKRKEKKRKREMLLNIAAFLIIALIVAAVLAFAAPFAFAKYNPERYAKQYIEAVISKDYGKVYDKSEGRSLADFGRDEFIAACEKSPELISISDGEITDFTVQTYGAPVEDMQNMLVTYTDSEGNLGQYIFPMQQISNGFWRYDEYAAVLTFDIICNPKIYAPRQTTVYINGTALAEDTCEIKSAEMENGTKFTYLEYAVPPMLAGDYTITAENPYCDAYEESIGINKLNSEIYIGLSLSEDGAQQLISAAQSNIETLINAAAKNEPDAASLPLTESFAASGFEGLTESLAKELYAETDYISVSDFAIADISLTNDFGKMPSVAAWREPRVTLDLTFNYTYKLSNSEYTYSAAEEQRSGTGYAIIAYTFADGKWQIDSFALQAKF